MRSLTGAYIKNGKEVKYSFQVPSSWSELNGHQYAAIITVLNYTKADRFVIATSLLALLFGKENFHVLEHMIPTVSPKNMSLLDDEDLANDYRDELIALANFLFEEPPAQNFLPKLKIRKVPCLAPADNLSNLSFGEWCFAFQYYTNYRITQDLSWLDKMIACLYRPADPAQDPTSVNYKGDLREVFNENLITKRAKDVAAIESRFKLAVWAWFTAAVNQVMAMRPNVFPKTPDTVDEDQEEQAAYHSDQRTWLSVFRELLGPKWGTTEQLKHTNAMFVLDAMEEQQIAYKESGQNTPA